MWKWPNECQLAFEKLKMVLVEDVTLTFADFEKEFLLEVNACKTGLGAVLYLLDDNLKMKASHMQGGNHTLNVGESQITPSLKV